MKGLNINMKKLISIVVMSICLLSILTGCVGNKIQKENSSESKKIESLEINMPYSLRMHMSMVIRSQDIEEQYGKAELTRQLESKSYEIRNINDGSKLIIIYDKTSGAVTDMWQLKKLLSSENFKDIYEGKSSSEDILNIDPYTSISETSENTAISEHRLIYNEAINIEYTKKDGLWIVENIKKLTPDPSNITNILIPEDLKLIS